MPAVFYLHVALQGYGRENGGACAYQEQQEDVNKPSHQQTSLLRNLAISTAAKHSREITTPQITFVFIAYLLYYLHRVRLKEPFIGTWINFC